ncbi:hypothetical protein WMY93_016556 [Mugilogobius chulae]|uniref:Uncharacterized protein n=1 Tax=Mugilogobius chulae TaxID=88201 RepID=A0AAW0NXW8_9GOBI
MREKRERKARERKRPGPGNRGHAISNYACSIPPTVTRLTLRLTLTLKDMEIIAPRVPNLLHLDIEQNRSSGSLCRRIPALFPHLRTLRIRFLRREPEKDLLNLQRLQHLERLDLFVDRWCLNGKTWPTPFVLGLITQLRELTENRVKVCTQAPPETCCGLRLRLRGRAVETDMLRDCDCVYEDVP